MQCFNLRAARAVECSAKWPSIFFRAWHEARAEKAETAVDEAKVEMSRKIDFCQFFGHFFSFAPVSVPSATENALGMNFRMTFLFRKKTKMLFYL